MTTILSGVVGSTAYGLAREGSDVDRAFDDMTPEQMAVVYGREDDLFRGTKSVLPPAPDRSAVSGVLRQIRRNHTGDA